jgi:K+-sensing histidine kinase KdpD
VDETLKKVEDYIEETQIIASCLSKVFRFNIDETLNLGNQEDLINVDEEIDKIARRMKVIRDHDTNKKLTVDYENKTDKEIKTDRYTFLFVVYNLIDNAIKYSYPDKEIRIECSSENSKFCLKIKSFGDPIPIRQGEESLPFQLFWRGEEQDSFKGKSCHPGLGVGLWACRAILRKQGGDIWLIPYTPTNKNQTIFSVKFP